MTPSEIVSEINKLPQADWETIKSSIDGHRAANSSITNGDRAEPMSEDAINRILFAEGIIAKLPSADHETNGDDEWELIDVEGEPLSEMIIRERR